MFGQCTIYLLQLPYESQGINSKLFPTVSTKVLFKYISHLARPSITHLFITKPSAPELLLSLLPSYSSVKQIASSAYSRSALSLVLLLLSSLHQQ